jgi:hypothetical protein
MPLFGIGHYLFLDIACRAFGSCGEWQVEILQQPFQAWVWQARYQSPRQQSHYRLRQFVQVPQNFQTSQPLETRQAF